MNAFHRKISIFFCQIHQMNNEYYLLEWVKATTEERGVELIFALINIWFEQNSKIYDSIKTLNTLIYFIYSIFSHRSTVETARYICVHQNCDKWMCILILTHSHTQSSCFIHIFIFLRILTTILIQFSSLLLYERWCCYSSI